VNLPNSITLTRICSIPLLIWILSTNRFQSTGGEKELLASALFIAASITDGIDGYLARKRGQITTMGVLLDPLADKLLIAAAFITLVQFNPSMVPAWIAVIIIGREFLVSGLRSILRQKDSRSKPATWENSRCWCRSFPWWPSFLTIAGKSGPSTVDISSRSIGSRGWLSGSWCCCPCYRLAITSLLSGRRSTGRW
jgi:CDP-diacylglycerol--glycerol-3-phosphate 3-phosphatidyltransferase